MGELWEQLERDKKVESEDRIKDAGMRSLLDQGFQRKSISMKKHKILNGKNHLRKPGQASHSSWGLAGTHCVVLSVFMELVEDGNMVMLGILSREPWEVTLPLLTRACRLSKDFFGTLTRVASVIMLSPIAY